MKHKREILIGCVAFLLALASFYFDDEARAWIAQNQNASWRNAMQLVSRAGDWPAHVALGAILFLGACLRKNKKWSRIFLSMLIACALAGLVARVVKITVGRARPSVQTEQSWNGPRFDSRHHAFPSGHVAASAAFFATLAFASWRAGIWFLWIPLLIAFSRMYVAAHFFSDVVCAGFLGILCALLIVRAFAISPPAATALPLSS